MEKSRLVKLIDIIGGLTLFGIKAMVLPIKNKDRDRSLIWQFLLSIVTIIVLLCYSNGMSLATGTFLLFIAFVALASFILEIAFNEAN